MHLVSYNLTCRMRDRWRIFIHQNANHRNGAAYDGGSYSRELSRSVVLPTHCQRLCDTSLVIKTMPSNHLYGPRDWPCQGWPFFLEGNAKQPYYKCIAPVTCMLMAAAFWWLRHGSFATRCQSYSGMFQDIRHSQQRTEFLLAKPSTKIDRLRYGVDSGRTWVREGRH